MSDSKTASGGIGLLGITFIVFLILKLTETGKVATWSWWWITCPLWGPLALVISFGILVCLIYFPYEWITNRKEKRERLRYNKAKIIKQSENYQNPDSQKRI